MEEEIIYEIVDSIINNQDKISELIQKISSTAEDEIYQKESLYKKYLSKNLKNIQKLEQQKKINEINLHKFKNNSKFQLKKIDDFINKINIQLSILENKDNNSEFYKKSFDKIKNALLNQENEENLKILNKEYNDIKLKFNNLIENIKMNESNQNKLEEISRILEEEKDGIKIKIIEYISFKESCEEIAKMQLKLFIFGNINKFEYPNTQGKTTNKEINDSNNIFDEKKILKININKDKIPDIEVFSYELKNIDINNLGLEMSRQIINLINNYIKSFNIEERNIINKNYINSISYENNINNNLDSIIKSSKIFYTKTDTKSLISILSSKIIKQIINFISSSHKIIQNNEIEKLFEYLNESILSFISIYYPSYIKINLNNSSYLLLYIKYIIKSFYYESIISSELFFLNEQYKNNKKEIKKNILSSKENSNKLKIKKDEYFFIQNKMEEKIKYLNEKINNSYKNLSDKELEYIKLNKKLNDLVKEKKQINYDLVFYENEHNFNNEKIDNELEILKSDNIILHKNILSCQEEIKLKNKQNEMEIEKLKKSIQEKFIIIKNQLGVYKKKHGDNLELYNKFVERINKSLRITNSPVISNKDDNLFRNTQSTFYKTNEKRKIKKSFYTPEKMKVNSFSKKLFFY